MVISCYSWISDREESFHGLSEASSWESEDRLDRPRPGFQYSLLLDAIAGTAEDLASTVFEITPTILMDFADIVHQGK